MGGEGGGGGGVVRAVRARGGVGMHWQPLNTLIYTMQASGKAKGPPAIGG